MNRLTLIFGAISLIVILCLPSSVFAQDPNDPGEYDTLYLTPGGMRSPTGDTLYVWPDSFPQDVTININGWNDNEVVALVVVLTDGCNAPPCSAELDPAKNNSDSCRCFEGSRVAHFGNLLCKVTQYPPVFYIGASIWDADPMPPGNGLLATFIFTVHDTGRICLDTVFHPVAGRLTFVKTQPTQGYCPVFEKRTFVISDCAYSSGDPNYDGITNLVDAVFLVNYLFRSGPPPCVEKSGDVNCDGEVTVADIVYLISYLFKSGPAPGYCP